MRAQIRSKADPAYYRVNHKTQSQISTTLKPAKPCNVGVPIFGRKKKACCCSRAALACDQQDARMTVSRIENRKNEVINSKFVRTLVQQRNWLLSISPFVSTCTTYMQRPPAFRTILHKNVASDTKKIDGESFTCSRSFINRRIAADSHPPSPVHSDNHPLSSRRHFTVSLMSTRAKIPYRM